MTDWHTHILPNMDDGSQSAEESIQMLEALWKQGVDTAAATPHYYGAEETIETFLARRAESYSKLQAAMQGRQGLPKILLGAETAFRAEMAKDPAIRQLCIGSTNILLVEMPFCEWSGAMMNELRNIMQRGMTPAMAHIERYIGSGRNKGRVAELLDMGALIQMNASHVTSRKTRRKAQAMIKRGEVQLIGSDCHNMGARAPNMGQLTINNGRWAMGQGV
jgi:protein-tyrosine phosphatase